MKSLVLNQQMQLKCSSIDRNMKHYIGGEKTEKPANANRRRFEYLQVKELSDKVAKKREVIRNCILLSKVLTEVERGETVFSLCRKRKMDILGKLWVEYRQLHKQFIQAFRGYLKQMA